jgi:DNA-binding transcriptional MerR regulator
VRLPSYLESFADPHRSYLYPVIFRGIREYSDEDLKWLDFVMEVRAAGVSIEPLIDYVRLCGEGLHTVPAKRDLWDDECDLLEKRIRGLQETLAQMKGKVDHYDGMLKG